MLLQLKLAISIVVFKFFSIWRLLQKMMIKIYFLIFPLGTTWSGKLIRKFVFVIWLLFEFGWVLAILLTTFFSCIRLKCVSPIHITLSEFCLLQWVRWQYFFVKWELSFKLLSLKSVLLLSTVSPYICHLVCSWGNPGKHMMIYLCISIWYAFWEFFSGHCWRSCIFCLEVSTQKGICLNHMSVIFYFLSFS